MSLWVSLFFGLGLAALISIAAYWRGALTPGGVVGALLTGTAVFALGGPVPGVLLVAFFVSSSLLSHLRARVKEKFTEKFQKGSRRDLGQALANGGWAALLAVAFGIVQRTTANARLEILLLGALVGALASVTADTWATEIGVLSPSLPRLITTGRVVSAGTSGGVTTMGTLTALAGGLFIGIVAVLAGWLDGWLVSRLGLSMPGSFSAALNPWNATNALEIISLAGLGGLAGALFDSLLGATVQAIYFCEYDEVQTEKKIHGCGRVTRRVRGWGWLDNDWVNFSSSVLGSLVALLAANVFWH